MDHYPDFFELEGAPVVDVVADIFFVREHFAHGGPGPGASQVGLNLLGVETSSDFRLKEAVLDKPAVDLVHNRYFFLWPGLQDHPVGLQALVLAAGHFSLYGPRLVDQHSSQTITRWSTLPKPQFDQAALPGEHFG